MHHALRHDESLARPKLDHTAGRYTISLGLEVDEKATLHDVEELVVGVVMMPVILALHDAKPHHGVVDANERLIPPLIAHAGNERVERNLLERRVEDIEVRRIGECGGRSGGRREITS